MRTKVFILLYLAVQTFSFAQGTLVDYQRAAKYLGDTLDKYTYNKIVNLKGIQGTSGIVYMKHTERGDEFIIANFKEKTKKLAFNQEKFATTFNRKTGKKCNPYDLPFSRVTFSKALDFFSFKTDSTNWKYIIKSDELTVFNTESKPNVNEMDSPDGKQVLILDNYNLKIKDKATGKTTVITSDGNEKVSYGTGLDYYSMRDETSGEKIDYQLLAFWSPDSKKVIIPKYDRTRSQYMKMLQWAPEDGLRPHLLTNERGLPGDTSLTYVNIFIFDVGEKKLFQTDLPRTPAFLMDFLPEVFYWTEDNSKVYTIQHPRGYGSRSLTEIDLVAGKTKQILKESSKTFVDIIFEYFGGISAKNEFIWMSEQDGWNHLYLYDLTTGQLKNQITKGNFVVREVKKVDEKNRKIYFLASGKENAQDPYLQQFYVINFDGTGLLSLTPENAEHEISFINNEEYFIDSYSTATQPSVWVVRSFKNPTPVMELEKIDVSGLEKLGWKAPVPFNVKARDGVTEIYGIMYRPSNFDPSKKYPIIDHSYSGPYTIRTPKSFSDALNNSGDNPLCQLGFIVVNIDGMGTGNRSKKFHDFSYKNLGDIGCEDHVKAIRELAVKYSYMDTTRVGIMGHSHGGYDAVRALILHPEFYKVSVSSAGCHDFRLDKEFYPEIYMGLLDKNYEEQSNIVNASKIKGKLLLLHGGIDNNCNIVETMKLVDELVKNNKDFDLIIVPNDGHGALFGDKYAIRKRWDFFVKNLLGVDPPKGFKIY